MQRTAILFAAITFYCTQALYPQSFEPPLVDFIDVNNILYWVATNGMFAHDPYTDRAGLEFPKGSGKHVMYTEGIVWGGLVDSEVRVGGSTYRYGLQRGKILPNGEAGEIDNPRYHLYKIRRLNQQQYGLLQPDVQARLRKDFMEWPVSDGAPWVDVDANGKYEPDFDAWLSGSTTNDYPKFEGDEVLWWVANDWNGTRTNSLYGTAPVGLEVHSTFWAYDQPGVLANTVFMKHKLINKSSQSYTDVYIAKWADPHVGDYLDDFVGVSEACQTGYAYNGDDYDSVYAARPPAVGHVLLQGPIIPQEGHYAIFDGEPREGFKNLPVSSFSFYINSNNVYTDPSLGRNFGSTMMYNNMRCRLWNSQPTINPVTGQPVCLALDGDPITGTGWIDGILHPPGDRRSLLSSGPFQFAPGDTQEVVYAVTIAQGDDHLHSVELLLQNACELRSQWTSRLPVSVPSIPAVAMRPELHHVYPNPVSGGSATVEFTLHERNYVSLQLTNILGQEKLRLFDGTLGAGRHTRLLSAAGLPPGQYLLTLRTSEHRISRMVVLR